MAELIAGTKRKFELSETARVAALSVLTTFLAVAFVALLISDRVQAAAF